MVNWEGGALRAQVQADYELLSSGVANEAKINNVFGLVMETTKRALRDSMSVSNRQSISYRISPEVLASCFAFLPLVDCIRVSHVSRHWRAVAVSCPSLWTEIIMECRSPDCLEFLKTILGRARQAPVELKVRSYDASMDETCKSILQPHLHHARYIDRTGDLDLESLGIGRALRYLHVRGHSLHPEGSQALEIPEDFLGGSARQLRSIRFQRVRLPRVCPALSTLVALHVADLAKPVDAVSFRYLFELCPRLESLTLNGLISAYAHMLPSGPAPETLQSLFLGTRDANYDLGRHYTAWQAPRLRDVTLDMGRTRTLHPVPQPLLHGATGLSVRTDSYKSSGTWVIGTFPDKRSEYAYAHMFIVPGMDLPRLASLVMDIHSGLHGVHAAEISVNALGPFTDFLVLLPGLKHLTVLIDWIIVYEHGGAAGCMEPDIADLRALKRLSDAELGLESLYINLKLSFTVAGLDIGPLDATGLLDMLASLGPLQLAKDCVSDKNGHAAPGPNSSGQLSNVRAGVKHERFGPRADAGNSSLRSYP
ncbi:hypothetical protein AURDEDRAFT_125795 [Auricularia subglabra TFB-10046 SS5]|nr:hypothetical protein AURDEDRAFT_125795 [Auricularia subglabra TFB-10046 SS5]